MPRKDFPKWRDVNGNYLSCTEKIKVMQQNMEEISDLAQDAFEDAILMGCDENQFKNFLINIINNLKNPYNNQ